MLRKLLDLGIRVTASMLSIHGINCILSFLNIAIFVGVNGYTLAVAALLGLPGILGIYAISYLM